MNKNSWNPDKKVILLFTELALIFVDEFGDKILDLLRGSADDLLGLFEEELSWVLERFHEDYDLSERD